MRSLIEDEEIEIAQDCTSLDLLRSVYRNPGLSLSIRMRAAAIALPFEFPRLAVTAFVPESGDFAMQLERRLKRRQEMKLIEAKPVANEV